MAYFGFGSGPIGPKAEIALGIVVLAVGIFLIVLSAIAWGGEGVLLGGFGSLFGMFSIGDGIRRLNREASQMRRPGHHQVGRIKRW